MVDNAAIELLRSTVLKYYRQHGRHDLPWRQAETDGSFNPYKIMVSEIMLQQTQVARVIPKYTWFVRHFPTYDALANSDLASVLRDWSGLGYNRRAKYLWLAAQQIQATGGFPVTVDDLIALPGVGKNTAGAIMAYAFNRPAVFIETNIRTVYIHHFFSDQYGVSEKQILPLVEQSVHGYRDSRIFYWALMDYGTYLKATVGNLNVLSKNYVKQSKFVGSRRHLRGQVIKLLSNGSLSQTALTKLISDDRLNEITDDLEREAMIVKVGDTYRLA